jgi:hypothetical protein
LNPLHTAKSCAPAGTTKQMIIAHPSRRRTKLRVKTLVTCVYLLLLKDAAPLNSATDVPEGTSE